MPPTLLISDQPSTFSRSIEQIRNDARQGLPLEFWQQVESQARGWIGHPVIGPQSIFPGRDPDQARVANRDYAVVAGVVGRLLNCSLAFLLTGEKPFLQDAVAQVLSTFDETLWPDWRDKAHLHVPADLRTGQFLFGMGLMLDWVGDAMDKADRDALIAGITARGMAPFMQAVVEKTPFLNPDNARANNWLAAVTGGAGVAAMALSRHDAKWESVAHDCADRMSRFLHTYGPRGESNESIGYSSATFLPAFFFAIHRSWTKGQDNRLARWPFPENCRWQMNFLLPGGVPAPFGDTHPEGPQRVNHYPCIADAANDGLIQWAYLNYRRPHRSGKPNSDAWVELLTFNPGIKPVDPVQAGLPLAEAYEAHSACIMSRTGWDVPTVGLTVFAKAGHGNEGHGHHDAGAVCVYVDNHPMIIDPGIPTPVYPKDFFGPNRYLYYQASSRGHNVPQIDARETTRRASDVSKIIGFDRGMHEAGPWAAWTVDLTPIYPGSAAVHRSVVHVGPLVAVLDRINADTDAVQVASRWHTRVPVVLDGVDGFFLPGPQADSAGLACRLIGLGSGRLVLKQGRQQNVPGFDRTRIDTPLDQKREPWIDAAVMDRRGIVLSVFVRARSADAVKIQASDDGALVVLADGQLQVRAEIGQLVVTTADGRPIAAADAPGPSSAGK
jgi:hypothetical protein